MDSLQRFINWLTETLAQLAHDRTILQAENRLDLVLNKAGLCIRCQAGE